eukprot:TRINITY_DN689_c0_g1_i1.p1 TRINITY_DN689_c0_g1~~TRINITY_DN689_c0_g1_i1.p1  ORF type:complete len:563 (+),score=87.32 TRINITY_DN689_c0_g1_i1:25-1689(+)
MTPRLFGISLVLVLIVGVVPPVIASGASFHLLAQRVLASSSSSSSSSTHTPWMGDQEALWFTQIRDHFASPATEDNEPATFAQKYYVVKDHWKQDPVKGNGPAFLYISGEGPLMGPPGSSGFLGHLAERFGGVIMALEHRFYGDSVPFATLDIENLVYLSSEQGLADAAYFIEVMSQPEHLNVTQWITVGGSYAGALSAWFRLKYPHLAIGSLSSSGVVNAVLDFTAFDKQVATSAGPICANLLRQVMDEVEIAVEASYSETCAMFNATYAGEDFWEGDFWFMMADATAIPIQYGNTEAICDPLEKASREGKSLLDAFATFVRDVFLEQMVGKLKQRVYSSKFMSETTVCTECNARQWWYQTCAEFGYWQNAPAMDSIRSPKVNMTMFREACERIFGKEVWPDTVATNRYYGSVEYGGTNVFFCNGGDDPWQHASITSPLPWCDSCPVYVAHCHDCGHCVDLGTYSKDAPDAVQDAWTSIEEHIGDWIAGQHEGGSKSRTGLSSGAIVGLILGAAVAGALAGFVTFALMFRKRRHGDRDYVNMQNVSTPAATEG